MKHQVLLVDDEANILNSLQRSLHKENYQIFCAKSASEALEILNREPIDLVVTDQEMPGVSGIALLAEVRQSWPDTARFMLTGKATLEVAVNAINEGEVNRFFLKPCIISDLAASIRQSLQQKDLWIEAKRLLRKVQEQSAVLKHVEAQMPGITQVDRDPSGHIILDDMPDSFEEFMRRVREALDEASEG